jgi:adenylate cyclase class IV
MGGTAQDVVEVEKKFTDIDINTIVGRLNAKGATRCYDSKVHTITYEGDLGGHFISGFDSTRTYLRIRWKEGKVKLTLKSPEEKGRSASVRREKNLNIPETMLNAYHNELTKLGLIGWPSTKRRRHYKLPDGIAKDAYVEIEEYSIIPQIPPYVELETKNEDDLMKACDALELDYTQGRNSLITEIYPVEFFQHAHRTIGLPISALPVKMQDYVHARTAQQQSLHFLLDEEVLTYPHLYPHFLPPTRCQRHG